MAYTVEGVCDYLFDVLAEVSQATDVLPFEARCNDTLWYLRDEFGQEIDYNATECTSISSEFTIYEDMCVAVMGRNRTLFISISSHHNSAYNSDQRLKCST